MANEIFTRIQLKYDSWASWSTVKDTFKPLKGEVCVVNPGEDATSCLLKVGDGSKTFGALPWVSAPAADVAAWAKAADVRLKDQKLEFFTGDNVIKTVDLSTFATEAEVNALLTGYKKVQDPVADPTANGKSLTFIDTISQNTQGVITATKKNVNLDAYALKTEIPTELGVMSIKTTDDDVVILTPEKAATGDVTITGAHKEYNKAGQTTDVNGNATTAGSSVTIKVPTLTVDKYGHTEFNGETSHTITIPSEVAVGDGDITIEAGEGLAEGGTFNVNQDNNDTITLKHAVPTGATEKTFGRTAADKENRVKKVITSVTTDKFGHIVAAEDSTTNGMFVTSAPSGATNGASVSLQGDIFNDYSFDIKGAGGILVTPENGDEVIIDGSELQDAIDATDAKVNTLVGTDTGKSARAIATEVAKAEIGSAGHLKREIVTELPAPIDADPDTIYMIYKRTPVTYVRRGVNYQIDGLEGESLFSFGVDGVDYLTYKVSENTSYNIQNYTFGSSTVPGVEVANDLYFLTDGPNWYESIILSKATITDGSSFIAPSGAAEMVIEVATGTTPVVTASIKGDAYQEYMLINGQLEQIGDTTVDLTDYATKEWADYRFLNTVTAESTHELGGLAVHVNGFTNDDNNGNGRSVDIDIGLAIGGVVTAAIANKAVTKDKLADDVIIGLEKDDNTTYTFAKKTGKDFTFTVTPSEGEAYDVTLEANGKADKVTSATAGNFAGLDANGNLTDSGKKAADFATKEQGAKADTAVQSVATGTNNGTIKVDGTDVAVKGLGSAAYTASTAYATAAQGTKADAAVRMLESSWGLSGGIDIDFNGSNQGYPDDGRVTIHAALQEGGVATENIADNAVTTAKLQGARKSTGTDNTVDIVIFNCGSATTVI